MGRGEDFHIVFHRFPQILPQFVHRSSAQLAADHYGTAHPGGVPSARVRVLIWQLKPWIRGGSFRGSGDDDPTGRNHGTFFRELPTPRPFARFPLYNLMNNEDGFAQLTFNPFPRLTLRNESHWLNLTSPKDLWYVGGGAFQNESFG